MEQQTGWPTRQWVNHLGFGFVMYIPCVFVVYYLLFVPTDAYIYIYMCVCVCVCVCVLHEVCTYVCVCIYIYIHTHMYILTPCSTVLLEKLTGFQLVKKFPAFYGTRMFITALTSARHLSLSLCEHFVTGYFLW